MDAIPFHCSCLDDEYFITVLDYKIKGFYLVGEKRSATYSRLKTPLLFLLLRLFRYDPFPLRYLTPRHITGLRSIL
jgi:hypothetical protein